MVMTDHTTCLIAAQAIGFALFRREKTGVGEAIEVTMFENMASFVTSEHMGAATFDPPVGPTGDGRLLSPHYRPLPTKDGFITVAPNTDAQAFAFFDAIRRPELKTDPRFSSAAARTKHAEEYFQIRIEGLSLKTTSEWLDIFEKVDVPCQRYNTIEDLIEDPHLEDVDFFSQEVHPTEGPIRKTRVANTFTGGGRQNGLDAPRLGGNTKEVLIEAGYTKSEVDALLKSGAAINFTTES